MPPLGVIPLLLLLLAVVLLASSKQATGVESLPPPRNVTLASKDFSLFLTWRPDERYPPGVSYRVQWRNPFSVQWKDIPHCRDISETICNITCVSPELNNRYQVQIKAQMRTGTRITSSREERKHVDYEVDVDIAPPVLQLRKTEHTLGVNATFIYPSCAKDIFQHDLTYNLKIWAERGTEKPKEFKDLTKSVVDINVTDWISGNYCIQAQAFFNRNNKWSDFSAPICTLLHGNSAALRGGDQNWGFVAIPFFILVFIGAVAFFMWYKKAMNKIKMPQALDFSRFRNTKKLLEFSGREFATMSILVCTEVPSIPGTRRRLGLLTHLTPSPSSSLLSEEDSEDDEDEGPLPYTEMLRFQKRERYDQKVSVDQKTPNPSSGSGDSEPNGGCCLSSVMISGGPFVPTEWVAGVDDSSGFSESKTVSLSESSSAESSLGFPVTHPTSRTEGQEDTNKDIDLLLQRLKESDFKFPTGLQLGGVRDHPDLTRERLEDAWVALCEIRDNQDSFDPLLKVPSCKEDLGKELFGENNDTRANVLSASKFYGYRPKHIPYLPRT